MLNIDDCTQNNEGLKDTVNNNLLKDVAILLMNNIRPLDRFYRYGKTEFVILMEELEKSVAVAVARD